MGLRLHKGDIIFIDLGNIGKSVRGHEQGLKRPGLVIKPMNNLKLAIILPISTKRPPRAAVNYVLLPQKTGNLNKDSYVLCHQIRTISFERALNRIGHLPEHYYRKVEWALSDFLEL